MITLSEPHPNERLFWGSHPVIGRPLAEQYQYRRNGSRPVPQGRGLVPRPRGFSDVARQSERRLVDRLPRGGRRGHLLLHRRGRVSSPPPPSRSCPLLPC